MGTALRGAKIGIFGAGHLGRAVASLLLRAGVESDHLALCHAESTATANQLKNTGLAHLVKAPAEVAERSDILLYLLRPRNYRAIAAYHLLPHAIFISFLAGITLENIPARVPTNRRARIMTSAPDTLVAENAIAALWPATNAEACAIIEAIGARGFSLRKESDMHAFTALGPGLPIALTFWESLGQKVNEREILGVARQYDLPDYAVILKWARTIQPRHRPSAKELDSLIKQAATPGGVTEAILIAMREGHSLGESLHRGIRQSLTLGNRIG